MELKGPARSEANRPCPKPNQNTPPAEAHRRQQGGEWVAHCGRLDFAFDSVVAQFPDGAEEMKHGIDFIVSLFTGVRDDHPARKGITRRRCKIGKIVSGNSKWHRRVEAAGLKGKC